MVVQLGGMVSANKALEMGGDRETIKGTALQVQLVAGNPACRALMVPLSSRAIETNLQTGSRATNQDTMP